MGLGHEPVEWAGEILKEYAWSIMDSFEKERIDRCPGFYYNQTKILSSQRVILG